MKIPFPLICIDVETTDTDSNLGSVIQIGAVALTDDFKEIDSFNMYVKPLDDYRNSKAMSVNKISESVFEHAATLQEALVLFENFARVDTSKCILASWGAYFDIPFLKAQYNKIYREWPFGHKTVDLKSIAIWEFAKRDIPLSGGVQRASQYLNLEFEGTPHDALSDIRTSVKILKKLESQEQRKKGW